MPAAICSVHSWQILKMLLQIQFITILLCLLFHPLLTLPSSFHNSSMHLCHHDEKMSLLRFKTGFSVGHSLIDECSNLQIYNAKTRSWKGNTDCCIWEGVTCDFDTGHVIGLDLSCSKLNGTIHPNSSLFYLQHLETLNLASNDFSSTPISPKFGHFRGLKLLNLSNSGFTGKVPLEIAQLSQLVSLDLSLPLFMDFDKSTMEKRPMERFGNFLFKLFEDIFGEIEMTNLDKIARNLTHLRELKLDGVKVNSNIPQTITNLTSLSSLQMNFCNLQGVFPSNILTLPKLQTFVAYENPNLQVDATKLFNLSTFLRVLDFSLTNLSGQLPNIVGTQPPLFRKFIAVKCNLYGTIPTWMWNTTEDVQLATNLLRGKLPSSLNSKELSTLNSLGLSENLLTGEIPSWVWSLQLLKSLELDSNQFIGTLDGSLLTGNSSLETIDLSMNHLSVEFNLFSELKNLTSLDLSRTEVSSISSNINCTLSELSLSFCNLSEFPYFLKSQHSMEMLDLSNNRIQGDVPSWFQDVGKNTLILLNISHNNLTGGIELLSWKNLMFIDLRSNSLQGPLPLPSPTIFAFLASNNKFHGKIPSSFCNLTDCGVFDVSNNNLSGKIPMCLGKITSSVQFLSLRSNKLQGAIKVKFPEDCNLESIHLSDNRFTGPLPRSLVRCISLQVIDFGNNQLNDTFPHWLNTLSELQVLVLQFNKFRDTIRGHPKAKHQFPKLQILDLSSNQFYGKLPESYIKNFQGMMSNNGGGDLNKSTPLYLETSDFYNDSLLLTVKGESLIFERILTVLTIMDLSNNNFSSDIPDSLGQLKALIGLNLSHNHLSGQITTSLANLTSLQFLDLSWNMLQGQLPQQLARLTFLETFSVSENQLTGPIPRGNQFDTFSSSSYEGNPGLCGDPLPRCGGASSDAPPNAKTPMSSRKNDLFDFTSIRLWEIILMGFGVGVIWGWVGGYCMISTGKPAWFSKKVDRMEYIVVQRTKKHYKKRGKRN